MTLGQRINQYRKALGISQEELGGRLGVSRQAVSKWETGAAVPDMNNLIALAREFGVSVAELTETPEEAPPAFEESPTAETAPSSPAKTRRFFWPVLCGLLAVVLASVLLFIFTTSRPLSDTEPEQTPPVRSPATDFALIWTNGDGDEEFLELGEQADLFPFGTALEQMGTETIQNSGYPDDVYHNLSCGFLSMRYSHISQTPEYDILRMLETSSRSCRTPRDIGVGSTEADVLQAYQETELIYCDGVFGTGTGVPHEAFYVYCPSDAEDPGFGWNLIFFLSGGYVTGVRMEDASYPYYHVNNQTTFPVKDGAPDFSQRQETPRTTEQQVYDALNALVVRNDLTAEELYTYRITIFSSLSDLDWWAFGKLGATEYPEDTINALLSWLREQTPYSENEIFRLQMGCLSNLDGWLADSYSHVLFGALFSNPVYFVKGLAYEGEADCMSVVLHLTAYDAELYPVELETALDTLDGAMDSGAFTETELGWAELLRLYLTTPIGSRSGLPKTPAELSELS